MKVTGVFSWKYILKLLKAVLRSELIHSSLALFLFFFGSRCSFLVHLGLALQNIDFGCSDITCTCKWSFFLCSVFSYSSFLFFFGEDTFILFTLSSLPSPVHSCSLAGIHSFCYSYISPVIPPVFQLSFIWSLLLFHVLGCFFGVVCCRTLNSVAYLQS